ncbi:hypothetical protein DPMN_171296 [Dreissena polymorpha]|uniref:Uncharacterized protein n=1 Tax=Dreissena polymorpha TaxID=45954 RepID=A0A9D4IF14_DREPO|nr:hypothetical protein DPMN_171296 [Dreissena polymorpha]
MAEASKSTMSVPAKTEGEMRRSKCVRQPSKRMLLYSQDTDSMPTIRESGRSSLLWDGPRIMLKSQTRDDSFGAG